MTTLSIDPEKTVLAATARSIVSSMTSSASDQRAITGSKECSPLELFQVLTGINTPPCLTEKSNKETSQGSKPGGGRDKNIGLYQRAKDEERTSKAQYTATSLISNTLYMLQILLAATFTALSAYKETHPVTLTVLGAINTVVAGSLAWQKGQGVPQRYRKAADQYQALVHEIEKSERAFVIMENSGGEEGVKLDARAEAARLEKLYETAKADQQANYPDLYVSTGPTASKDAKDLTKQLEDAKAEAAKIQSELLDKIKSLMNTLESHVEGSLGQKSQTAANA